MSPKKETPQQEVAQRSAKEAPFMGSNMVQLILLDNDAGGGLRRYKWFWSVDGLSTATRMSIDQKGQEHLHVADHPSMG